MPLMCEGSDHLTVTFWPLVVLLFAFGPVELNSDTVVVIKTTKYKTCKRLEKLFKM